MTLILPNGTEISPNSGLAAILNDERNPANTLLTGGTNSTRRTLLHYACRSNLPLEEIQLLVECGNANVNSQDWSGSTPLHYLCEKCDPSIATIEYLFSQGANVSISNNDSLTALHFACTTNPISLDLIRCLLANSITTVNGANDHIVNQYGKNDQTPLNYACINLGITLDVIKCLVDHGASVQCEDDEGATPLHYICNNESVSLEMVQYLVTKGADAIKLDYHGRSTLHYACRNSIISVDIIEFLVNQGVDVNARCKFDHTPVQFLFRGKNNDTPIEAIQMLWSRGADLQCHVPYYDTLLNSIFDDDKVNLQLLRILFDRGVRGDAESCKRMLTDTDISVSVFQWLKERTMATVLALQKKIPDDLIICIIEDLIEHAVQSEIRV